MATQLTDPWAAPAAVVCDFGWYTAGNVLFPPGTYKVNGVQYPPSDFTWTVNGVTYSSQRQTNTVVTVTNGAISTASYQTRGPFLSPLKQTIMFDATDSRALGLPKVVVPSGIQIVSYEWDLGNGATGVGPTAQTTYNYTVVPPDTAVTLLITDSLDRSFTTTHVINLAVLNQVGGTESRQIQGAGRS